jgi:hypothetical protein
MSILSVVEVACEDANDNRPTDLRCHLRGFDDRWEHVNADLAKVDGETRIGSTDTRVEFDDQMRCDVDSSNVLKCREY